MHGHKKINSKIVNNTDRRKIEGILLKAQKVWLNVDHEVEQDEKI